MFKKGKSSASPAHTRAVPIEDEGQATLHEALAAAEADLRYDEAETEAEPVGSAEDTARYIADMVGALAAMAGDARLDLLTYLLNMARVEAELQARQTEEPEQADD
ncbi:hypothetical protein CCR94_22630 [Rhodoblastus sphagnicola]|uniref:Uncharacterized protein n=1 Tax=Rhodoblastus sphagnicola TaxID=333368 RepID=A0A2S6MVQ2_9HYPH|nr:hypothetical protein [Rhodoblastus sphagnicola]MBB4198354.1 hypothetical protein [Rhodoblastus sphagnicola]PPQ26429.1 hypothetical protein CCR94_22630 [Rhodoblastus sphagnicola]